MLEYGEGREERVIVSNAEGSPNGMKQVRVWSRHSLLHKAPKMSQIQIMYRSMPRTDITNGIDPKLLHTDQ